MEKDELEKEVIVEEETSEDVSKKIKKRNQIPLSEEIYHIKVLKDEDDITEDGNKYWECWLREPSLSEEENLLTVMSNRILTATQMALQSLWLEGDEIFKTDKGLIKSSMALIGQIFETKEAIIEKK